MNAMIQDLSSAELANIEGGLTLADVGGFIGAGIGGAGGALCGLVGAGVGAVVGGLAGYAIGDAIAINLGWANSTDAMKPK